MFCVFNPSKQRVQARRRLKTFNQKGVGKWIISCMNFQSFINSLYSLYISLFWALIDCGLGLAGPLSLPNHIFDGGVQVLSKTSKGKTPCLKPSWRDHKTSVFNGKFWPPWISMVWCSAGFTPQRRNFCCCEGVKAKHKDHFLGQMAPKHTLKGDRNPRCALWIWRFHFGEHIRSKVRTKKNGHHHFQDMSWLVNIHGITCVEFIRSTAGLSLKQSSKIIIKIDTIPHGIVVAPDFPTHYSQLNFQPGHFRKVIFQLPNNIPSASQTWQLKIPPFWIIVVHCTIYLQYP